ncbi:protein scarlet-like [Neocloeon triangulifer]|uniref:protein scarlet-like n=1 Tax=Neocloeon triangulifer TaxID=2078957 RepID=UPI00286FA40D|nr:protein scarlet-like [Neocloeon triangulifer]
MYPSLLEMDRPFGSFASNGHLTNNHSNSRLTLSWKDLSVWGARKRTFWGRKKEQTQILRNVSGIARGGRLIAIMGASGAGKTTLLATISQRTKGECSGEIRVNGKVVGRDLLRKISGFVPQQDLAVDSLTVREHMEFMGNLKVVNGMRNSERTRWVKSLLSELNLLKCEDTRLSALSGGERKRLSLAVQLLTDPPILFCDEPTTGLDSFSAAVVVEKLRLLSERGMAIVCTIHQPASGIFDLFHELILLAGGRVAYQGEVSAANQYFSSKGLRCPATYSAAEFYVTQLAIRPGKEDKCTKQVLWLCDQFAASPEGNALQQAIDEGGIVSDGPCAIQWKHQLGDYINNKALSTPSRAWQLYWILWRSMVAARRDKTDIMVRMLFFMFVGLVISMPFVGTEKDQRGIQNTQGLFYLIVVETIFTFAYSVFNTFPQEIPILLREISDDLYKPGPYYLSKMIMLIPRCIVGPFFYVLLIFSVVGLNGGFLGFLALCVPVMLCAASATAYGCMMSALFESVSTASLLSVPIDLVTISFSGLFLRLSSLPIYLSWLKYLSQFYFSNEAVSILQWQQVTDLECWDDIPGAPCLHNGEEVLENYGFSTSNLSLDLLGLSAIYCVSHLVGFLAIVKRSKAQAIY